MVRRRQLSAKKPKRVNEPLDFLASGGKRKAQKGARGSVPDPTIPTAFPVPMLPPFEPPESGLTELPIERYAPERTESLPGYTAALTNTRRK